MKKALRIGKTLWVHMEGRTFAISLEEKSNVSLSSSSSSSSGLLKSPMPGKILRVEAKPGDKIKKGETVCVIEAMKMEYALKAPFDGTLKEIFKNPNDQVTFEEKVALLEESK